MWSQASAGNCFKQLQRRITFTSCHSTRTHVPEPSLHLESNVSFHPESKWSIYLRSLYEDLHEFLNPTWTLPHRMTLEHVCCIEIVRKKASERPPKVQYLPDPILTASV